jgi:hypothetical protein
MFVKSSVHTMFMSCFSMEPSTAVAPDKSVADVVVIMESGVQSLVQRLQFHGSRLARSSVVVVLCNAYPPRLLLLYTDPQGFSMFLNRKLLFIIYSTRISLISHQLWPSQNCKDSAPRFHSAHTSF